jgi:DNA modification methylase
MRKEQAYFNNDFPFNYYKKHYRINIGSKILHHPNEKPLELIQKLIKISSKEDDLVVDFFNGGGTTTLACKLLNRKFLGFEINKDFVDIANKRLCQEVLKL